LLLSPEGEIEKNVFEIKKLLLQIVEKTFSADVEELMFEFV
jgi:hypothetical protein